MAYGQLFNDSIMGSLLCENNCLFSYTGPYKKSLRPVGLGEYCLYTDLEKNKLHELHGVQLLKRFSAIFDLFSAKFGSLNVQIRNNFKNVSFIAYK